MQYLLGNLDITSRVNHAYTLAEKRSIAGEDLIRISNFNLVVWNEDLIFSPNNANSIFYGRHPYEEKLTLLGNGYELFAGRVKKVIQKSDEQVAELEIASYIDDTIGKVCIYVNENITPSHAAKEILKVYGLSGYVNEYSFSYSQTLEKNMGLYCDINYLLDDTITVSTVIQELANIAGADIFFTAGKICFLHPSLEIKGNVSLSLKPDYLLGPIQFWIDTDQIKNQFNYKTDYGDIYDTYVFEKSRLLWGTRSFPRIDVSSSNNISCTNVAALLDAGIAKCQRTQNQQHFCQFSVNTDLFDFPFNLMTLFCFDPTVDLIIGIYSWVWQVIELNRGAHSIEITAVRIK